MLAARQVEPEWLDELPPDHPRAIRSRRDLIRVKNNRAQFSQHRHDKALADRDTACETHFEHS